MAKFGFEDDSDDHSDRKRAKFAFEENSDNNSVSDSGNSLNSTATSSNDSFMSMDSISSNDSFKSANSDNESVNESDDNIFDDSYPSTRASNVSMNSLLNPHVILEDFYRKKTFFDILEWAKTSSLHWNVYQNSAHLIFKYYLKRYNVLWEDPFNFVYVAGLKQQSKFILGHNIDPITKEKTVIYDFKGIAKLYNKFFNTSEIKICAYIGVRVTSVPIFPKLCKFTAIASITEISNFNGRISGGEGHGFLRDFSYQPNLKVCCIKGHPNFRKIPFLPELISADFSYNGIETVQEFPKLKELTLKGTSPSLTIESQPNMLFCDITHNERLNIDNIKPQPELISLKFEHGIFWTMRGHANANKLAKFPKLEFLNQTDMVERKTLITGTECPEFSVSDRLIGNYYESKGNKGTLEVTIRYSKNIDVMKVVLSFFVPRRYERKLFDSFS